MTERRLRVVWVPVLATLLMAAATGAWLTQVPDAERARVNPMAGQPENIAAGASLYNNYCALCHGADGNGRASRPSVRSPRVTAATDGELFWLLEHGVPFHGMPSWKALPEEKRWQIVAYLRSIQPQELKPSAPPRQ